MIALLRNKRRRADTGFCYPEGFDIMKMKIKLPKPNLSNWRVWLQNCGFILGGFIAGGLTVANWAPPKQLVIASKEVKTIPVDVRATVACTASLAATENLRKDITELCKVKVPAAKAAVAK